MSTSLALAKIRLTQNKDAIAKLRRVGKLVKDQYGERFDAMFDGMPIPFWLTHEKEVPLNIAEALTEDYVMPIDEGCRNCTPDKRNYKKDVPGTGVTVAGECHKCKGTGWADTNTNAPLFKILTTTNPANPLNPMQQYQQPPVIAAKEVSEALTNAS